MEKPTFLLAITLLLTACSPAEEEAVGVEPPVPQATAPAEPEVTPVTAEVEPTREDLTAQEVVEALKAAGLEVGGTPEMGREDFGMAPYVGEKAVRLLIPSLGEDAGGRVFEIADDGDRELLSNYYKELGRQSAMFYSHIFEHKNILVQISGDLSDEKAKQYEDVLKGL